MPKQSEPRVHRRHLRTCAHFGKIGIDDECRCPFVLEWRHNRKRFRQALGTSSRQKAERKLGQFIRDLDDPTRIATETPKSRTLAGGVQAFLDNHGVVGPDGKYKKLSVEFSTFRKYRAGLRALMAFCERRRIKTVRDLDGDVIEAFRNDRLKDTALISWSKELPVIRGFLGFCVDHGWATDNAAKKMKGPRGLEPNEIVPYSLAEESRIIAACREFGRGNYERLRALAMVLLFRHTALSVGDVAVFARDRVVRDEKTGCWRFLLRRLKTDQAVYLPIPNELKLALDSVPAPRNSGPGCEYYFWNGKTSIRAAKGIVERTMQSVLKKSGVAHAHPHRFRHTLATRLLAEQGATFEQVADILGNTPEIVRKHYAKWAKGRQDSVDHLMFGHFATLPATGMDTERTREERGPVVN